MSRNDELIRFMEIFPNSFINQEFEMIAIPKFNCFFRLEDVKTEKDLFKKAIAWLSRLPFGANYYSQQWRNIKFAEEVRSQLNEFLGVKFNNIQWNYIYCKLGNGCNQELMDRFVDSNLDFNVFDQLDYQELYNLLVIERSIKQRG